MNYLSLYGQTVFDLAINTIADLNSVYALIEANPLIPNIGTLPTGIEVIYTPPNPTPPIIASPNTPVNPLSVAYSSISNQSTLDITLQTYGDLNLTYKLIKDSGFSSINSLPIQRTVFYYNPNLVNDTVFASYLLRNLLQINTYSNALSQILSIFGEENLTTIFISEDGTSEFIPES